MKGGGGRVVIHLFQKLVSVACGCLSGGVGRPLVRRVGCRSSSRVPGKPPAYLHAITCPPHPPLFFLSTGSWVFFGQYCLRRHCRGLSPPSVTPHRGAAKMGCRPVSQKGPVRPEGMSTVSRTPPHPGTAPPPDGGQACRDLLASRRPGF